MKKERWSSDEKLEIVLDLTETARLDQLRYATMAEVCNRHGISQTTYYKWRDRLVCCK
ncbi:MAG: transposase [Candidatus Zixiibacteriota bacterium]